MWGVVNTLWSCPQLVIIPIKNCSRLSWSLLERGHSRWEMDPCRLDTGLSDISWPPALLWKELGEKIPVRPFIFIRPGRGCYPKVHTRLAKCTVTKAGFERNWKRYSIGFHLWLAEPILLNQDIMKLERFYRDIKPTKLFFSFCLKNDKARIMAANISITVKL